ncbi:sugar ABC transporter permease [Noviherbaspirillum sp.]|jgi:raffinose/stachyose/melibiose transport system permease protein|uniref:carbohydrate ABC transporter permease n=1 Tax=Noviherbaspirillum sp. TaxID=1926288 RepID=UPI0025F9D498|nr:sugar ABC transporter permease [Noviherbaspirillum sp.]
MQSTVLTATTDRELVAPRRAVRWHIAVFLAPAMLIYFSVMVLPLVETLRLAFFQSVDQREIYVGMSNFAFLFGDERTSWHFWNALKNNTYFFLIHMLVMVPLAIFIAALLSLPRIRGGGFYRTAIFMPTMLSFVIVAFVWRLILSPLWGIAPNLLDAIGLKSLFAPYLGKEAYALTTLGLISVWKELGVPMVLMYAAMLSIPTEILEAAEIDGIVGLQQFFKIKLPLLWPSVGVVAILTFVSNFNSFDLIYTAQGVSAGPNYSTDILGTLLYRTFFGAQFQFGDPHMGATIATMMFLIILAVVCVYLFFVQRKLQRYQF